MPTCDSGESRTAARELPRLFDVHQHVLPPAYLEALARGHRSRARGRLSHAFVGREGRACLRCGRKHWLLAPLDIVAPRQLG